MKIKKKTEQNGHVSYCLESDHQKASKLTFFKDFGIDVKGIKLTCVKRKNIIMLKHRAGKIKKKKFKKRT